MIVRSDCKIVCHQIEIKKRVKAKKHCTNRELQNLIEFVVKLSLNSVFRYSDQIELMRSLKIYQFLK